jgi:hypothetical protein
LVFASAGRQATADTAWTINVDGVSTTQIAFEDSNQLSARVNSILWPNNTTANIEFRAAGSSSYRIYGMASDIFALYDTVSGATAQAANAAGWSLQRTGTRTLDINAPAVIVAAGHNQDRASHLNNWTGLERYGDVLIDVFTQYYYQTSAWAVTSTSADPAVISLTAQYTDRLIVAVGCWELNNPQPVTNTVPTT